MPHRTKSVVERVTNALASLLGRRTAHGYCLSGCYTGGR
jgi:hypothetical protein